MKGWSFAFPYHWHRNSRGDEGVREENENPLRQLVTPGTVSGWTLSAGARADPCARSEKGMAASHFLVDNIIKRNQGLLW